MPSLDVRNHKHVKRVIPRNVTCDVQATNRQATSTNLFNYFLFIYMILVHDVLKD